MLYQYCSRGIWMKLRKVVLIKVQRFSLVFFLSFISAIWLPYIIEEC